MKWLIDEMFPVDVSDRLDDLGHDARSVTTELRGRSDDEVFEVAARQGRTLVTENVVDFTVLLQRRIPSGGDAIAVVFVSKASLPRTAGALSAALASRLATWADEHPDPVPTAYWL